MISRNEENKIFIKQKQKKLLKQKIKYKRSVIFFIWAIAFTYLSYSSSVESSIVEKNIDDIDVQPNKFSTIKWKSIDKNRNEINYNLILGLRNTDSGTNDDFHILENEFDENLIPGINCTPPAIDDFPPDLFTQSERQGGAVVIHFLVSVYLFYTIAIICDDYFVPSIECICDELNLPSDVAGATFMAIATSSPELFTNVIGTFITEGDIGIGTIVGSAVFNILAIAACCGFAVKSGQKLQLEWWPLTRDCVFYSISVILLILVLLNRKVFWYEALGLVCFYFAYIGVMYKNTTFKRVAENLVFGKKSIKKNSRKYNQRKKSSQQMLSDTEETPLIEGNENISSYTSLKVKQTTIAFSESTKSGSSAENEGFNGTEEDENELSSEIRDEILIAKALHQSEAHAEEEKEKFGLFKLPRGESVIVWIEWIIGWPIRLVLTATVPDCREQRIRSWYPLTFIMCIVWIASLSYLVSWMMTVIGHTLQIPDSVMGLTFIAAGTSVPEAVSSIIVARQGLGAMGISNSIGSNTFDILICLGLPWLIRGSMIAKNEINYILINSSGLEYSTMSLMASLFIIYIVLACNRFVLDKKVSIIALIMYTIFLIFSSLVELNMFFPVNLPTCGIK